MIVKKRKVRAQLPFRLNILFLVVFLLFSVLILQLGVVQILDGASYQEEIESTIQDTTKISVPRGKIYDRNHKVVVDNEPLYSITYTPPKGIQPEKKLEVAEELAKYISIDEEAIDKITERNKKEYWYIKSKDNQEKALSRLTDEEKAEMNDAEQYQEMLDRITEEEISGFTDEELKVIAIKRELDKAYSLTPQVIKNEGVTPEEYARVAEHLDVLPGINATTDWDRGYPYKDTLSSFLGSITSQDQGIPKEKEQYYLTKGYSRNDRVGRSGLEEQYEDVLRGRKEHIQYTTNKSGKVIDSKVVVPGERGKDLVLTIDMEFQERVDKIVRDELKKATQSNPHLEDALAVVMNPKTGELLAVSGQHYNREEKKYEDAAFKTVYDAHRPGSTVKGATVLAGYESGVITPGQTFYDAPIDIHGTPTKSSWTRLGSVNDLTALERSSNVYMFYIAMRMAGEYNYYKGKKINFNREGFQTMRNNFHQLGLGVKTGVDLPFEATGYVGDASKADAGNLLDLGIGQYDTYTTMQLAQYVSTIANGGYRVRPHFVKEIREPTQDDEQLGPIYRSHDTEVLNKIEMDDSELQRVQEGFRRVFQGAQGTGVSHWRNKKYNPAGKTGTAENEKYVDGVKIDLENLALVGYAPYDNPEVAFAVIIPNLSKVKGQNINHAIGTRILDTYFELKEERNE